MKLKTLHEETMGTADFIVAYLNDEGVDSFVSDRFGLTKVVIPLDYSMRTGERTLSARDIHKGKTVSDNISILTYPDGSFKSCYLTRMLELSNSPYHEGNLHDPNSLPELLEDVKDMIRKWERLTRET